RNQSGSGMLTREWSNTGGLGMTEAEWLAATDLDAMYDYVAAMASWQTHWLGWLIRRPSVSMRKLRLFFVACYSRILGLMPMEEAGECVYLAERLADGGATVAELEKALSHALQQIPLGQRMRTADAALDSVFHLWRGTESWFRLVPSDVRRCRTWYRVAPEARLGEYYRETALGMPDSPDTERIVAEEAVAQADLFRDIVGNPFRPVHLAPAWLSDTVRGLAAGAYEGQLWSRLPILA